MTGAPLPGQTDQSASSERSARCVTANAACDSAPANVSVLGRPGRSVKQLSSNSPRTPFTFAQTKNEGLSVASVSAPDGVTVAVLSSGYMKLAFPESLRKRARIRGEVSAEPFCWTRRAGSRARASARFSTS